MSNGTFNFVPIRDDLQKNDYVLENLNILEDGEVQYMQDGQVVSHKGIDVSKHQGNIDWTKVAADGVEFAFIRVGLRGYGTEGKLVEDEYFEQNVKGALQAGIKVGVYFYSQAITDEELLEEANLVLEKVKPYNIELAHRLRRGKSQRRQGPCQRTERGRENPPDRPVLPDHPGCRLQAHDLSQHGDGNTDAGSGTAGTVR